MTTLDAQQLNDGWEHAYTEQASSTLWQDEPSPLMPWLVEIFRRESVTRVVDAGCGDGRNVDALARGGFQTLGIDVSPTALRRAAERFSTRGLDGFFVRQDLGALDLATESVDAVTCIDVFNHIYDPQAALAEVHRVLRPGGLFATNVFNPQDSEFGAGEEVGHHTFHYRDTMFRFYDEDELRGLLSDFTVEEFRSDQWVDPPHGDFRPYEHTHVNFVLLARKAALA